MPVNPTDLGTAVCRAIMRDLDDKPVILETFNLATHGRGFEYTPASERAIAVRQVREHHLRLIDLCDRVKVLNPSGYVGDNTRDEIRYARQNHKGLEFMEPVDADWLAEVTGVEFRGFAEITVAVSR